MQTRSLFLNLYYYYYYTYLPSFSFACDKFLLYNLDTATKDVFLHDNYLHKYSERSTGELQLFKHMYNSLLHLYLRAFLKEA